MPTLPLPDLNFPPPDLPPASPAQAPRSRQSRRHRHRPLPAIAEHPKATGSSSESLSPSPSPWRPLPRTSEELQAEARRLSFSQSLSPPPRQPQSQHSRRRDSRRSQRQPEPASSPWTQPPSSPAPSASYAMPPVSPAMVCPPAVPTVLPFQTQEAVATAPPVAAAAAAARELAWAWAAEAAGPQLRLYTVEGNLVEYKTKWEELHPASQWLLLQIEDKMREYIYDSKQFEQLDTSNRLYDPSVSNMSFELNASQISQEIRMIPFIMDREKASIESLMVVIKEILRNADFAICSYARLRLRFVHRGAGIANAGFGIQPLAMAPTFHYFSGSARRPSPFMQQTVARFEKELEECCKLVGELEQLVRMKNNKTYPDSLGPLSTVISNVYDYFIHAASKVENLHQLVEKMRIQYLNDRRRRGDRSDPFLEADRREATKQETAARRVHPTLHLPPSTQPTAPVAAPVIASQLQESLFLNATPFESTSTPTLRSAPSLCGTSTPSSAALSASGGTITFSNTPLTRGRSPRRRR